MSRSKMGGAIRDPKTGRWPTMAGGAPDNPIPYPLDPVSVTGTLITLDQYVNQPTVITRTIQTLAQQRFYAHNVFSPGPGIEGGALLFERPNPLLTDLYAARRTQEVAPGSQFPVQKFVRGVPMVALPRKIGEKFGVTKEERKRNKMYLLDNAMAQAANTLNRDVEIMALSELNAVIASTNRTTPAAATWASYAAATYLNTTRTSQPLSDLISAQVLVDLEERGTVMNAAIFHPTDLANLRRYYNTGLQAALDDAGISDYWSTPRQVQGRVKLFEKGQVGVWSNEFPLDQNSWFDEDTDNTWWYQWSYSPLFAVTNQFKMLELTGV